MSEIIPCCTTAPEPQRTKIKTPMANDSAITLYHWYQDISTAETKHLGEVA